MTQLNNKPFQHRTVDAELRHNFTAKAGRSLVSTNMRRSSKQVTVKLFLPTDIEEGEIIQRRATGHKLHHAWRIRRLIYQGCGEFITTLVRVNGGAL